MSEVKSNYRSHCYKCGRFVPAEYADIMWLPEYGCYEEGYPECPPEKGCNTAGVSQGDTDG